MKTFPLEIYAMDKTAFRGQCESMTVPAMDGEFGVLANHEPIVIAIQAGELRYTHDGKTEILAVGDGFMEISELEVYVMVDFAERADEIDLIRAQRAAQRAEEKLRQKRDARTMAHAQAALARAVARMKVGNTYIRR